jgi:hypothetical protein
LAVTRKATAHAHGRTALARDLIDHADASGRDIFTDRPWLDGTMDTIETAEPPATIVIDPQRHFLYLVSEADVPSAKA